MPRPNNTQIRHPREDQTLNRTRIETSVWEQTWCLWGCPNLLRFKQLPTENISISIKYNIVNSDQLKNVILFPSHLRFSQVLLSHRHEFPENIQSKLNSPNLIIIIRNPNTHFSYESTPLRRSRPKQIECARKRKKGDIVTEGIGRNPSHTAPHQQSLIPIINPKFGLEHIRCPEKEDEIIVIIKGITTITNPIIITQRRIKLKRTSIIPRKHELG